MQNFRLKGWFHDQTMAGGQKIRVLLIDENPLFLSAATAILLRQEGLVVLSTAAELETALVGVREFQPAVIALDPNTPGSGGPEVVPRLRTLLPGARIVVLALIDSSTYREAAQAVGADGFVSKANMVTDLLPTIRQVAQMRTGDSKDSFLLTEKMTAS